VVGGGAAASTSREARRSVLVVGASKQRDLSAETVHGPLTRNGPTTAGEREQTAAARGAGVT
jgi:hypothetical protein